MCEIVSSIFYVLIIEKKHDTMLKEECKFYLVDFVKIILKSNWKKRKMHMSYNLFLATLLISHECICNKTPGILM